MLVLVLVLKFDLIRSYFFEIYEIIHQSMTLVFFILRGKYYEVSRHRSILRHVHCVP